MSVTASVTAGVLAVDCATEILSVALGVGTSVFTTNIEAGMRHSELLFPALDGLLKLAGIVPSEIGLFVCQRGPGSWTGLRIGFAAVKGFALALGRPYISIPTLDCMAWAATAHRNEVAPPLPTANRPLILPVVDAKQGRFFCALYDSAHQRLTDYLDASPATIISVLKEHAAGKTVLLTGDSAAVAAASEAVTEAATSAVAASKLINLHYRRGSAKDLLKYIEEKPIVKSEREPFSSAPLYLRKCDAELNLRK